MSEDNNRGEAVDNLTSYQLSEERINGIIDVHIAEYNALRREIDLYHQHQKRIMQFMIVILTTLLGILGSQSSRTIASLQPLLPAFLLFPLIFTLLSLLYLDRTIRIIRIADYLHNHLRNNVEEITAANIWQWEIYKSHTELFDRRVALILDRVRWMMFVIPSILCVMIFIFFDTNPLEQIDLLMYVFNFILILISLIAMWVAEETTGINVRETFDLYKKENEGRKVEHTGDNQ